MYVKIRAHAAVANPGQMPREPRARALSRAQLVKWPNGSVGRDEDVSGSSSSSDRSDERSDAEDEDGETYTDPSVDHQLRQEYRQAQALSINEFIQAGGRLSPPVEDPRTRDDARLALSLSRRVSGRQRGEKLLPLHYLGLWSDTVSLYNTASQRHSCTAQVLVMNTDPKFWPCATPLCACFS